MVSSLVLRCGVAAAGLVASVFSQSRAVVPAICAELPGNAAVSLPLRWSHGTMQVRIDAGLLPGTLAGQSLLGLRLRRPAFLGEGSYAALQRTLTVRAAFQGDHRAAQMNQDRAFNRPASLVTVFGPAAVTVAATASVGPGGLLGSEYLHLPFTAPLPVPTAAGQHLFLEFETSDAPLVVSAEHWIDAVWFENGNDRGYAVPLGDGGCSSRSEPFTLRWTGSAAGPARGGSAQLRVSGAWPAGSGGVAFVLPLLGFDPQHRAPGPAFVGFGASLAGFDPALAGCHQWTPIDAQWSGTPDAGGGYTISFALPPNRTTVGQRIGVQCAMVDLGRAGVPASFTNGVLLVLDTAGVGDRCGTVFFPGAATISPWLPSIGLMPVVVLEY